MGKTLRSLAAAAITLMGIGVIAWICSRATSNDYIEYWSSGKLLLRGIDPYSVSEILALEKAHGFLLDSPLIMLNPPWALFLVVPLGLVPSLVGLCLWIVAGAACVLASLLLLEVPAKYRMVAFLFAPVIATFSMEQSSPFLLLGLSLFLRLHRSRPFLSGVSLLLMSIKPHLFLVFWLILLADCLYRRSLAALGGLAAGIAGASAFAVLFVPRVFEDYIALIRSSALEKNYFPTLPTMFRMAIDVRQAWLALVPSAVAMAWGLWFYWRRRGQWDWRRDGMPVILVAVAASPYGWTSDMVVFLPALALVFSASPRKYAMEYLSVLNVVAFVSFILRWQLSAWVPVAFLAWYLYAVRSGVDRNSGLEGEAGASSSMTAGFSS